MRRIKFSAIKFWLPSSIFLVLILGSSAKIFFELEQDKVDLIQTSTDRAKTKLAGLAFTLETLQKKNTGFVQEYIALMLTDPLISDIDILDHQLTPLYGKALILKKSFATPKGLSTSELAALTKRRTIIQIPSSAKQRLLVASFQLPETGAKIRNLERGLIIMQLDLNIAMAQLFDKSVIKIAPITIVALLIFLLYWLLIKRFLVAPLEQLAIQTQRLSSGKTNAFQFNQLIPYEVRKLSETIEQIIRDKFASFHALSDSEARLRLALEAAKQGLFDLSLPTGNLHITPEYAQLLGFSQKDVKFTLKQWLTLIHPLDKKRIFKHYLDFLRGKEKKFSVEFRQRSSKGRWNWMLSIGSVVEFDTEQKPLRMLGTLTDISEQKENLARIERLANYDSVTNLPNRTLLADRVTQAIYHAHRHHNQLALLFLDIDHFKHINDSLGHHIGDKLLVCLADVLSTSLREDDTVARLGGDEFVVLLPATDNRQAALVAEKLVLQLNQVYLVESHSIISSASVGIAMFPQDGHTFGALSKSADAAMYRAKAKGRNNYQFFTEEMHQISSRRLLIANALHQAIELNQFSLVFQPQIKLPEQSMTGMEVLLRWQHPEFGAMSPAEFIPIAEDTGFILKIDDWVLVQAIEQLAQWQQQHEQRFTLSINVSAMQFHNQALVSKLKKLIDKHQIQAQQLELEVTETAMMNNPQRSRTIIKKIRQLGIGIAIDDFGTGYSSLNYLKLFEISKVKIDQSFVKDIGHDNNDEEIIEAIINLAHNLGYPTIAEGTETKAQIAFLQSHGCDMVQGYFFAKPMSATAFELWFLQHQKKLQATASH